MAKDIKTRNYFSTAQEKEEEFDARAAFLYREFLGCQGYLVYRTKGKKKAANAEENAKWPDFIEWAFFRAIVRIPPCGRQQVQDPNINGGKKMGRNELIGHFIGETTGISRGRKQVSSHLQVLRNYTKHRDDLSSHLMKKKGQPASKLSCRVRHYHDRPSAQLLSQNKPKYPGIRLGLDEQLGPPIWSLYEFDMSLRPSSAPLTVNHTYSRSGSDSKLVDLSIEHEHRGLAFDLFPDLFQNRFEHPVGGSVISVDASFTLPGLQRFAGQNDLAIYLSLLGPATPGSPVIESITTFCSGSMPKSNIVSCGSEVVGGSSLSTQALYQVPFCSSRWVALLSRLGAMNGRSLSDTVTAEVGAHLRSQIDSEFRSLTALQQVTVYSKHEPRRKHHITLHWKFHLSPDNVDGRPGTIRWRHVAIPPIHVELPTLGKKDPQEGRRIPNRGPQREFEGYDPLNNDTEMHDDSASGSIDPVLGSPFDERREGWDTVREPLGKPDTIHYIQNNPDASLGLDMSFEMEPDMSYGASATTTEGDFDFADYQYPQPVKSLSPHFIPTESQSMAMEPGLMGGESWELVYQASGSNLEMKTHEPTMYHQAPTTEMQAGPWRTGNCYLGPTTTSER